jgi:hypothetical protein
MAQQRLDHPNIDAALQQVSCKTVAQCVQRHALGDPGGFGGLKKQPRQLSG